MSELAQLAEELHGDATNADAGEDTRAAFIKSVARNLSERDVGDAAVSRARIQEQHKKLRRKDKQERRGDASDAGSADEQVATLGSSPSPSPPPARTSTKTLKRRRENDLQEAPSAPVPAAPAEKFASA